MQSSARSPQKTFHLRLTSPRDAHQVTPADPEVYGADAPDSEVLFGHWRLFEEACAGAAPAEGRPAAAPNADASLAERRMPSFAHTLLVFVKRALVQLVRDHGALTFDLGLALSAGAIFGKQRPNYQLEEAGQTHMILSLGVGLVLGMSSLRVFGAERAVFWRECAPGSGMALSRSAYFLAKNLVELPRIALLSIAVLCAFSAIAQPRAPFGLLVLETVSAAFAITGYSCVARRAPDFRSRPPRPRATRSKSRANKHAAAGCRARRRYIFSTTLEPKGALLAMVLWCLISIQFSGFAPTLAEMEPWAQWLSSVSFARWCVEDGVWRSLLRAPRLERARS